MSKKIETLTEFINNNDLDFDTFDSGLNGACTILCGYADHVGITRSSDIVKAIKAAQNDEEPTPTVKNEVARVFAFAQEYNYGSWWNTEQAKLEYSF